VLDVVGEFDDSGGASLGLDNPEIDRLEGSRRRLELVEANPYTVRASAGMGLAELRLKCLRPRLVLLEVGEDRVSEIVKEEHVSLAQLRSLLVCQTAEHVEAGVETG